MKKRGYFFLIDALIALFVLAGGIALILSYKATPPSSSQLEFVSYDLYQSLSANKLGDFDNVFYGRNGIYMNPDAMVANPDNTVLQQIAEFYYRNKTYGENSCGDPSWSPPDTRTNDCIAHVDALVGNLTSLKQGGYRYVIMIDNVNVSGNNLTVESAFKLVPTRKIVHGIYEDEFYGPYIAEVLLWQ